jgi:hypothetical protein
VDANDLVEFELIKQLKYRYVRCLDQKLWSELARCFAPDATAAYSGGANSFSGRDEIVAWIADAMGSETMLTGHRVGQPELELTGPDTATGTWALDDIVIIEEFDLIVRGGAFYRDDYRRIDGEWAIAHTGYKRTFELLIPQSSIEGLKLTASWWGTDGQSRL